jgi:hypothetical protein
VDQYKDQYQSASKAERQIVVRQVVQEWRSQDPPGRFISRTEPSKGTRSFWHDVGDEVARRKAMYVVRVAFSGQNSAEDAFQFSNTISTIAFIG